MKCNLLSGHCLYNSQAVTGGQTTSYLPCTMVVGMFRIRSTFSFLNLQDEVSNHLHSVQPRLTAARLPSMLC